ncbi:dihydrolipoamide acetyltransferase family protein [Conexibacter sp. DBS9H8]|uniref:dihydrolipoamide acetyltransferase family protein n=1 Tax=Conexibacter sp. DBS9H8 TaxID=2937801 RepID=UPI00200CCC6E|nr:dihydrolipoamide acetyltransferase family protein [Conexibacter sp. DBS9H8]
MSDFILPALAEHTTSAVITAWLRKDGDSVEVGDDLVEVETDKAVSVLQADASGTLVTLVQEGETVAVGAAVATIGVRGPAPALVSDGAAEMELPVPQARGRREASPVARRLAASSGINLDTVEGSGPRGRILKRDVDAVAFGVAQRGSPARVEDAVTNASALKRSSPADSARARTEPMSCRRQLVSRRMVESNTTIPDFSVEAEVDMTACRALREQMLTLNRDPVPSYNDMVIKAAALALRAFPRANSSMDGDMAISLHNSVNVAFAVSISDDLFAPVVFDADQRSLGEIARTARSLIDRIKDATIEPGQLSGATFTVSNLGMFGVTRFTAVVTPPQAAILAIGAVREAPIVRDGELTVGSLMSVTLSSDHRILYGAEAARFVQHLRVTLEQPAALLL